MAGGNKKLTRLSELTLNVIRLSHDHSAPSLKISCKSVQPFSHNVADKETKKSPENNTPSPYRGRGKNAMKPLKTAPYFKQFATLPCELKYSKFAPVAVMTAADCAHALQ